MLKNFIAEQEEDAFFYRDSFRRFIIVAVVLLAVNYFLVGLLIYQLMFAETPPYFATTSDGRIINIHTV